VCPCRVEPALGEELHVWVEQAIRRREVYGFRVAPVDSRDPDRTDVQCNAKHGERGPLEDEGAFSIGTKCVVNRIAEVPPVVFDPPMTFALSIVGVGLALALLQHDRRLVQNSGVRVVDDDRRRVDVGQKTENSEDK